MIVQFSPLIFSVTFRQCCHFTSVSQCADNVLKGYDAWCNVLWLIILLWNEVNMSLVRLIFLI